MSSESSKRATAKYHSKCKRVLLVLNPENESDIIEMLDKVENKSGYIKSLVRKDCKKWQTCSAKEHCNKEGTVTVDWAKYGPRKCLDYENS